MGESSSSSNDQEVEIWKMKRLIKSLESAKGNGTSMISLIIPPRYQIGRMNKMLADEFGTASNIKSRVNRVSVLGAISSVQQRLRLYSKIPPNGLVIYTGLVISDQGKNKKINVDFEPFKPINTSLYLCDNKFHTEALTSLLVSSEKVGFIIIDGNGVLFGSLDGNVREILHKYSVDLPKKHGRGGQSALRFSRQRMEKRHNYIRKVAESAVELFITNDKPNIVSIIIAGSGELKSCLYNSDMLDGRLRAKVIKVVDISYGAEKGFNQAIEQAAEVLQDVKFVQEKKLLNKYFKQVAQDTGKYCFGVQETLHFLEQGVIETLICWENLDIQRYVMKSLSTNEEIIMHVNAEQGADKDYLKRKANGAELDQVDSEVLLDWLALNYKNYGANLVIITDKSNEGNQFVHGFGGIGALLRYKVDFQSVQLDEEEADTQFDISEY